MEQAHFNRFATAEREPRLGTLPITLIATMRLLPLTPALPKYATESTIIVMAERTKALPIPIMMDLKIVWILMTTTMAF